MGGGVGIVIRQLLVFGLFLIMFVPAPALAECTVTSCDLQVSAQCVQGGLLAYHWDYTLSSDCPAGFVPQGVIHWGDGHQSTHNDDTYIFYETGTYEWELWLFDQHSNKCIDSGTITIVPSCQMQCSVDATVRQGSNPPTVDFAATINKGGCDCGPSWLEGYSWKFFAGGAEVGNSSLKNPSFTYRGAPPYTWKLEYTNNANSKAFCEGTIDTRLCLTVGKLRLCADEIAQETGKDIYHLTGNVHIGDLLFVGAPATFEGSPASGEGTLKTSGPVTVKTADRPYMLFKGPSVELEVDGENGKLVPSVTSSEYGFTLSGIPLFTEGSASRGAVTVHEQEGKVDIEPTVWVGIPGVLTLAEIKAKLEFPEDGKLGVGSMEFVGGQSFPSIKLAKLRYQYIPEQDKLDLTVALDFPFTDWFELDATAKLKLDCDWGLNGFDVTAGGGPIGLPLGVPPWGEISHAHLAVDNLCAIDKFGIFVGGNVKFAAIPEEILLIQDIGGRYDAPKKLTLSGGTANFLGYPFAQMHLTINGNSGTWGALFQGSIDLLAFSGAINLGLSIQRSLFIGSAEGVLTIPDFECNWYNPACRVLRRAVKSAVTLPYQAAGVRLEVVVQRGSDGNWNWHLRGPAQVGPMTLVVMILGVNTSPSLLIGSNYSDLYQLGRNGGAERGPHASERPVAVPAGRPVVLFGAAADSTVPNIFLRNPAGQTITPQNASSFPGVSYIPGDQEKVAIFQVLNPAAGTWVLSQDSLPADQVQFVALSPEPAPVTSFTSVQQGASSVSISASVNPASDKTKVGLFYSTAPDGFDGDWIAVDLQATSGAVSASWDISGLGSGTYYLSSFTDDGMNPPVRTVYSQPITVNWGIIQPPTGLAGTRAGASVTLSWTPSSSPSAALYGVLYTDAPEKPGYPLYAAAIKGDGAEISDLDPSKGYRFCVVAFDAEGNCSVESDPWTARKLGGIPGDCDGNGAVSIGEVQKAINMFLGTLAPDCGVDCGGDGQVAIGELQKVINAFLGLAASC